MLVTGTPSLSGFVGRLVSGMYTPSVWFSRQAGNWCTLFVFAYCDKWCVKLCIPSVWFCRLVSSRPCLFGSIG